MPIFPKLVAIYEQAGYRVRTGLNPWHVRNYRDAPFTALIRDGHILRTGGGVSLQEIYFFECLLEAYRPGTIFIVGNAFGWSTILLALLAPQARVVAIDAGVEGDDNEEGIRLTNEIAVREGLNAKVVKGYSPQDVEGIVAAECNGPIDLAFIDGLHTENQQALDFQAVFRHGSSACLYLFHDVVNWKMEKGFFDLARGTGFFARLLYRTSSGMGVLCPAAPDPALAACLDAFTESPEWISTLRKTGSLFYKTLGLVAGNFPFRPARPPRNLSGEDKT